MDSNPQPEIDQEPELAPLVCPRCAYEISEEPWPAACPNCQKKLDLPAQFAYCRGLDAFTVGQELLIKITPKQRRRNLNTKEELEGLEYYKQAYSSLQVAFQGELAESQRLLGIRMFTSMTNIFQMHAMVSPLEYAYWSSLQKEANAQLELVKVKEKLKNLNQGGLGVLAMRFRWYLRVKQLEKALIELDTKIRFIEQNIVFVERPRFRRGPRVTKS